ncbi:hypothetical protein FGO68_gene3366 [Halteria grandinella]|uniref:Uncharacterized protein n=1 Tax=Halteria grandinella TaxID=5974 RepID=A0A8J8SVN6_HALGN|nr:hypothetical protein FGO68_gene3366 [Halteria grandinella]
MLYAQQQQAMQYPGGPQYPPQQLHQAFNQHMNLAPQYDSTMSSVGSQIIHQQDNTAEKISIEQQINSLQKEIDNNFGLSKNQIMDKKRLINQLIARKNKL